jgi:MFS family permease
MLKRRRLPLRTQLRLITFCACLAMIYGACENSPVATEFFRSLGADDVQFGLLGGIPMIMLAVQFAGAYVASRIPRRKPWFIALAAASRCAYLVVAVLPLLFHGAAQRRLVPAMIAILSVSGAVSNLIVPLWFSWMGDLIPRRILNRYWGERMRYTTLVWAMANLAVTVFAFYAGRLTPVSLFFFLCCVGTVAGVVDILLFVFVEEPPAAPVRQRNALRMLLEPLRHPEYRTLLAFSCAFSASAMFAAAFMRLYVLKVLDMGVWRTALIWSAVSLGSTCVARTWGFVADRHGHRPVILLCVYFKPIVAAVFLLVTRGTAFAVLTVTFFFDSMLNAGHGIATNGYMLKMAPRENRSMFVASMMALAGISGDIGAIGGGYMLRHTEWFSLNFLGREWENYHLLFLVSTMLRVLCIPLAVRIREPESDRTGVVASYLAGLWPMRIVLSPVGLVRRALDRG